MLVNSLLACLLPVGFLIMLCSFALFGFIGPEKPYWGSGQLRFFFYTLSPEVWSVHQENTSDGIPLKCCITGIYYSATTWTGPLQTKLTNQSVNWEQRMASFFVNRPMKLKKANNGLTTKIGNPTKLRKVADVSGNFVTFWLVRFDPIFWNFFRLFNGFKRFR